MCVRMRIHTNYHMPTYISRYWHDSTGGGSTQQEGAYCHEESSVTEEKEKKYYSTREFTLLSLEITKKGGEKSNTILNFTHLSYGTCFHVLCLHDTIAIKKKKRTTTTTTLLISMK